MRKIECFGNSFLTAGVESGETIREAPFFEPLVVKESISFNKEKVVQRDRVGNRFLSGNLTYAVWQNSSENGEIKLETRRAGILVSQSGESLIKENPKVLSDIDQFLKEYTQVPAEPHTGSRTTRELQIIQLAGQQPAAKMEAKFLSWGGQSRVYYVRYNNHEFVIKRHANVQGLARHNDVVQPYSSEMLQTQAVATDLRVELDEIGIRLTDYYFASSHVSCTEFIDGKEPQDDSYDNQIVTFGKIVSQYVQEQRQRGNTLWLSTDVDYKSSDGYPKRLNFIIPKNKGPLVCIDPFFRDDFK